MGPVSTLRAERPIADRSFSTFCSPNFRQPLARRRLNGVIAVRKDSGEDAAASSEATSSSQPSWWAPFAAERPLESRPVQTQRGVPAFKRPIPDDPCPHCNGTGKTTCGSCRGKGRLNYRSAAMLPSGAWPQWCPQCNGTGRWVCAQCMGTGVKREPIGFRVE